ncbi:hypothetical protein C8Q76DRAFT_267155 [Earliella scabrosa]|nr:hypothetical protein C8Q76DRAFT_267155 [Earliella scabrosa]
MPSLKARLLLAEEEFLAALTEGGDSICAFETHWEAVVDEVNIAAHANELDDETTSLAHVVATRLAHLAETSADLFASYDTLTEQLVDQLDGLIADLRIDDVVSTQSHSHAPHSESMPPLNPKRGRSVASSGGKRRRTSEDTSSTRIKRQRMAPRPHAHAVVETIASNAHDTPTLHRSSPSHPVLNNEDVRPCLKRRRSESDGSMFQVKRRYVGPRLHAVSDSFAAQHIVRVNDAVQSSSLPSPDAQTQFLVPPTPLDLQPLTDESLFPGIAESLESYSSNSRNALSDLPDQDDLDRFLSSLLSVPTNPLLPPESCVKSGVEDHYAPFPDSPLSALSLSLPSTPPPTHPDPFAFCAEERACVSPRHCGAINMGPLLVGAGKGQNAFVTHSLPSSLLPSVEKPEFIDHRAEDWNTLLEPFDPLAWLSFPPLFPSQSSLFPISAEPAPHPLPVEPPTTA